MDRAYYINQMADRYEGEFRDDKIHGQGILYISRWQQI